MPDILHDFPIAAEPAAVFQAVATPEGLDQWWTARSAGSPAVGSDYQLWFGPGYDWRARVTLCEPGKSFELEMTGADDDWTGTRIAFHLALEQGRTWVRFCHTGWREANRHFRQSAYCWALYLRLLQRYLEQGAVVAYEDRLTA